MVDVPVLIISFNRPEKTRQLLEALRGVAPKKIYYAVDGPRWGNRRDANACSKVRELVSEIDWSAEVKTLFREENLGCKEGVVGAIDWFFSHEPEGIILEDDCLPAPEFFPFCQQLLAHYRDDERIFMVGGSNFNLASREEVGASYFFTRYTMIWGWASWRRAWQRRDVSMSAWKQMPDKDAFLRRYFPRRKERKFRRQSFDRVAYEGFDTWDYQWHFTVLAHDGLTIVASENLVSNVGLGPDATHTREVSGRSSKFGLDYGKLTFPLEHPEKIEPHTPFEEKISADFAYRLGDVKAYATAKARRALLPLRPLGLLTQLGGLRLRELHHYVRSRYMVTQPEVINLNANDICNSHCTMCNIWKNRRSFEASPDDIRRALADPLFRNVQSVGVTGGEPTLRRDLPEVFQALIDALPRVRGLSLITNAIRPNDVIRRIKSVSEVARHAGKSFGVMVSLDGVGEVHDRVRGTPGNFESAIEVIEHLREHAQIPVSVGCTISKENVWEVDDLLYYLRKHDIYGRFRVAELIRRLCNDDRSEVIRNFDRDETYHLALFFKKLELAYEKHEMYKRTYRSIHNMLLGEKRLIGCPYQADGVVFNAKAELAYCAPKSEILGSALEQSAKSLYRRNLMEKRRILRDACDNCIHDYHAPITSSELSAQISDKFWRRVFRPDSRLVPELLMRTMRRSSPGARPTVMIVGWYGTETVGDKAILGGIVDHYRRELGDFRLVVASIYPFVTRRTLEELGLAGEVVPALSAELFRQAARADFVVMGGGPLMHIDELSIPLLAFRQAKRSGARTVIFGCGIGPLVGQPYVDAVDEILELADTIRVRDEASKRYVSSRNVGASGVTCTGDPAADYVARLHPKIEPARTGEVACFLREWTSEYAPHLSRPDFFKTRKAFEKGLAQVIRDEAERCNATSVRLYHMHNFVVGNDDRDFSRRFIDEHFAGDSRLSFDARLSTIESIIAAMKAAKLSICMRFHSVLFADTIGVEFRAVDYTLGGKVFQYLKDRGQLDRLLSFDDIAAWPQRRMAG